MAAPTRRVRCSSGSSACRTTSACSPRSTTWRAGARWGTSRRPSATSHWSWPRARCPPPTRTRRRLRPQWRELAKSARPPLSLDRVTTAAVALEGSRRRRRGQIYVALAAVAWSTAGVLQRQLTLDTPTQVSGRALFAGFALLGYVAVVERGRVVEAFRSIGVAGLAVALCVATASGSFIAALNHDSVARVLFILAVAPVLAALLAWLTLGEPITR